MAQAPLPLRRAVVCEAGVHERSAQVPSRHRLTGRLTDRLERAASRSARALSDVAAGYAASADMPETTRLAETIQAWCHGLGHPGCVVGASYRRRGVLCPVVRVERALELRP